MKLQAAEKHLPKMSHKKKVPWLSLAVLEIAARCRERRRMGGNREEINGLNSQFQASKKRQGSLYQRDVHRDGRRWEERENENFFSKS